MNINMKLSRKELKEIIKEELSAAVDEGIMDTLRSAGKKIAGFFSAEENDITAAVTKMEKQGKLPVNSEDELIAFFDRLIYHFDKLMYNRGVESDEESIYQMVADAYDSANRSKMIKGTNTNGNYIDNLIRSLYKKRFGIKESKAAKELKDMEDMFPGGHMPDNLKREYDELMKKISEKAKEMKNK